MNKKFIFALEMVWLCVAILSIGAGIHKTIKTGIEFSYPFFIIAFIAVFMYFLRRVGRKNRESQTAQKQKPESDS